MLRFFLVLFLVQFSFGQNINNQSDLSEFTEIIPPSPTTAQMMMLEHLPINHYTGQPNINIDLGNYKHKSLEIPLNLRYSTFGNKVDNRSGWVGTGWALNSEMVISRTVVHIPDETNLDNPNKEVGILHNHYSQIVESNNYSETDSVFQSFLWNSSGVGTDRGTQGVFDKEYDIYNINILNKSASFILKKKLTPPFLEVKFLTNDPNFKVIPSYNSSNFNINSFIVIDTSGNEFFLNVQEITNKKTAYASQKQGRSGTESPNINHSDEITFVSAWKCSSISDYTGKEIASVQYEEIYESYKLPRVITENKIPTSTDKSLLYGIDAPSESKPHVQHNKTVALPRKSWQFQTLNVDSQKLQSISLSNGTEISFQLKIGNHPEYSASSSKLLESITIKHKDVDVKKFSFSYGMTSSSGSSNYRRVYLEKVSKTFNGGLESQDTDIAYNGYLEVEANSGNSDIWGYYYEEQNNLYDGFLNSNNLRKIVNTNSILVGLIKSIKYPNGGLREFDFESNTFNSFGYREATTEEFNAFNLSNWDVETERIHNSSSETNIPDSRFYVFEDQIDIVLITRHLGFNENTCGPGIINPQDPYVSPGEGDNPGEGGGCPDPSNENLFVYKVDDFGQEHIGSYSFDPDRSSSTFRLSLEPGSYVFQFIPDMNVDSILEAQVITKTHKQNPNREIHGGGVRIKSITIKDSENSTGFKKAFHYDKIDENDLTVLSKTSGVVDGFFTNTRESQRSVTHYLSPSTNPFANLEIPTALILHSYHYKTTTYLNSVQSALKNGSYVGYENVIEVEESLSGVSPNLVVGEEINFSKGFKLFKYTTPKDYPSHSEESLNYPFSPVVDKTHKQGLLKSSFNYDYMNRLTQKKIFNYTFNENLVGKSLFTFTMGTLHAYSKYFHSYTNFVNNVIGIMPIEAGFETVYITPNNIIGPIMDYEFKYHYNTKVMQTSTETTDYFYETIIPIVISTLKETEYFDNDFLEKSIKTTIINSSTEDDSYIKKMFYYPNHKPSWYNWSLNSLRNSNRISKIIGSQIIVDGTNTHRNATIFKNYDTSSYSYSPGNNLNNTVNEVGEILYSKSNENFETKIEVELYDSDRNFLQVKQSNGTPLSYIYGYSNSQPVAQLTGVSYSAIPQDLIDDIHSYSNADDDTCIGFNPTSCSESQLRSSLNNLRSHYSNDPSVQITTYTYDPLIGVTSITDPRGETTYYEYDDFNRLKAVKDAEGNLLEETEYNYSN